VEQLLDLLGNEDEILLADGFNEALIGHAAGMEPRAVYDYDRCIDVLVEDGRGDRLEEARMPRNDASGLINRRKRRRALSRN